MNEGAGQAPPLTGWYTLFIPIRSLERFSVDGSSSLVASSSHQMLVRHPPRQLTFATLLLAAAAGLANPVSVRGAVPAAALVARSRRCTGVAMTENSLKQELTMPARWKNVHDCERPSRWREQVRPLLGQAHACACAVHLGVRGGYT